MRHLQSVSGRSDPSEGGRTRVVVADGHSSLRCALKGLLEDETDLEVVAVAADVEAALRHVRRYRPEVLVLDLHMPDGSIAERIQRLQERSPITQIVVTTMDPNPLLAEQARRGRAVGFVLKDTADVELCHAVRDAARGTRYVSPRLIDRGSTGERGNPAL